MSSAPIVDSHGPIMDSTNLRTARISPEVAGAIAIGVAMVAVFFAWEGRQGFSLWDEGYLWYGVQRVMLGEVPIRDFQAYDPGRYYWSALLMRLTGSEGIMAVRTTVVLLQAAALAAALGWLAAPGTTRRRLVFIAVCALTLVVWMVPRHKVFDITFSIGLVCVLASLVRRPSRRNYFVAGAFVGLVAYFGRNHGVYGVLASGGVLAYLALRCESTRAWFVGVALFAAGGVVGYLPMFATMLLAPGFTTAFVDSVKFLFEVRTTNLPLPIPWPWRARFGIVPPEAAWRDLVIGLFFVSTLVFGVASAIHVAVARWKGRPVQPLLVACAASALPYAHYAFSRADAGHLAQGIFPTLIGLLVLAGNVTSWRRYLIAGPLCLLSLFAMATMHPGLQCMHATHCPPLQVGRDTLWVDPATASDVGLLHRLQDDFARDGRPFYVTPLLPGAWAVLHARAPTWEIYTAWDRSDAFQRGEIARLEAARPGFILVYDMALDGRDELRFAKTHPLIERYIRDDYIPVEGYSANPSYQIYRARDTQPPP
jgi:hypothetical protein